MNCGLAEKVSDQWGASHGLLAPSGTAEELKKQHFFVLCVPCHPVVIPSSFCLLGSDGPLVLEGVELPLLWFQGFKGLSVRAGHCSIWAQPIHFSANGHRLMDLRCSNSSPGWV